MRGGARAKRCGAGAALVNTRIRAIRKEHARVARVLCIKVTIADANL
jgi:hypothetical protein